MFYQLNSLSLFDTNAQWNCQNFRRSYSFQAAHALNQYKYTLITSILVIADKVHYKVRYGDN